MVKTSDVTLATAAATVGCWLLAPSSSGFAAGGLRGAPAVVTQHSGAAALAPEAAPTGTFAGGLVVCAAGAAAAAAGATAAGRRGGRRSAAATGGVIARPAEGKFAGGIVGSEYHGWGKYEWDPLQISSKYPQHLPWYREAELKHGRVAMLAFVGLVVPDFVRIPLPDFEDASLDFVNAHNKLIYGLGQGPMWWLLVFCGIIESLRFRELGLDFGKLTLENAGDLNFGKGFLPKTEEGQVQMKIKELKNGRLAMLAVSGALTQGVVFNNHHIPFM